MINKQLHLHLLPEQFGIARLHPNTPIPNWAAKGSFNSITHTRDELSIVCPQKQIPDNVLAERDWRIFKVAGPLGFTLIGIISRISTALASHGVSIFTISTYDTDYVLVKEHELAKALTALKKANIAIVD
jgi:hypothetical protein